MKCDVCKTEWPLANYIPNHICIPPTPSYEEGFAAGARAFAEWFNEKDIFGEWGTQQLDRFLASQRGDGDGEKKED